MADKVPIAVPLLSASRTPGDPPDANVPSVLSYFAQRRAAGYIGLFLPVVVYLWHFNPYARLDCVPSSISGSYYTGPRNFFVGSLCAVGVFLVSSIGYRDDLPFALFAGAMAFLVAFCPTAPDPLCSLPLAASPFGRSHLIHTVAACLLFATFAYFCLFLFTRSGGQTGFAPRIAGLPRQKQKRNAVFILCGFTMLAAMLTEAIWSGLTHFGFREPDHLLLIVEWICLWSFGVAWLIKGQQLLKDERPGSPG